MAKPSGLPPRPKGEREIHRESAFRWNETKNKTVLRTSSENRHGERRRWWLSTNAHNRLRCPVRQHLGTRPRRLLASISSSREQDRETNGLISAPGTRTPSAAHQTIESAAESEIGPTFSQAVNDPAECQRLLHESFRRMDLPTNGRRGVSITVTVDLTTICEWETRDSNHPPRHPERKAGR
jgi:hypothetical protein